MTLGTPRVARSDYYNSPDTPEESAEESAEERDLEWSAHNERVQSDPSRPIFPDQLPRPAATTLTEGGEPGAVFVITMVAVALPFVIGANCTPIVRL